MEREIFENFVFVGIPREAAEIAGIGPSTVVNFHADKGVLMLVKEQEEAEQGVCICPECLADMLAESEDESYG